MECIMNRNSGKISPKCAWVQNRPDTARRQGSARRIFARSRLLWLTGFKEIEWIATFRSTGLNENVRPQMMLPFRGGSPLLAHLYQHRDFRGRQAFDSLAVRIGELFGDQHAGTFQDLHIRGLFLRFGFGFGLSFGCHMNSFVKLSEEAGRFAPRQEACQGLSHQRRGGSAWADARLGFRFSVRSKRPRMHSALQAFSEDVRRELADRLGRAQS